MIIYISQRQHIILLPLPVTKGHGLARCRVSKISPFIGCHFCCIYPFHSIDTLFRNVNTSLILSCNTWELELLATIKQHIGISVTFLKIRTNFCGCKMLPLRLQTSFQINFNQTKDWNFFLIMPLVVLELSIANYRNCLTFLFLIYWCKSFHLVFLYQQQSNAKRGHTESTNRLFYKCS